MIEGKGYDNNTEQVCPICSRHRKLTYYSWGMSDEDDNIFSKACNDCISQNEDVLSREEDYQIHLRVENKFNFWEKPD